MDTRAETQSALDGILAVQRADRLAEGVVTADVRRARIQSVIDLLVANYDVIVTAIDEDFGGRPRAYSIMNDILGSLGSLKHARDHLEEWMVPSQRATFAPYDAMGATAHVRYQPKGTIGIIGTWNAPVFTLLSPLAYALAAGNRAVLKPSETVPRLADLLAKLFAESVDPLVVTVVTGGPDVAEAFTSRAFDHIVFTGSTNIGKAVMRNAAENLVPITLELGGKSPTILGSSADLALAAERIAIAKTSNSGQLCVCADIVYVPRADVEKFVDAMTGVYAEMLPTVVSNPEAISIVDERHANRIRGYLDDARGRGVRVVPAIDEPGEGCRLPLHVVVDPPAESLIMQEEIFGPAVIVLGYDEIDAVIADINSRPTPLALYYFGADDDERATVLDGTLSGGVSINELMMHTAVEDAPFGGVGASGMGHYHGREGFLEFSHARTVYDAPLLENRREYGMVPPYAAGFEEMLIAQITP